MATELDGPTPECAALSLELERRGVDTEDLGGPWEEKARDLEHRLNARVGAGLREFVQEIADEDCGYGDNCPDNAGTRHGTCMRCKAVRALSSTEAQRPVAWVEVPEGELYAPEYPLYNFHGIEKLSPGRHLLGVIALPPEHGERKA